VAGLGSGGGDRGRRRQFCPRGSHRPPDLCDERERGQGLDGHLQSLWWGLCQHRLPAQHARDPALAGVLGRSAGKQSTGLFSDPLHPGQWFQSESGLHQNWMRDYDPTTGRYLQADPLGLVDGASVYGYVKGNPGRWVDPRGLLFDSEAAAAIEEALKTGGRTVTAGSRLSLIGLGLTIGLGIGPTADGTMPESVLAKAFLDDPGCPNECKKAIADAVRAYDDLNNRLREYYYAYRNNFVDANYYGTIIQRQARLRDALRRVGLYCVPPPSEFAKWSRRAYQDVKQRH
jgi:RHS repeat-associated protein